MRLKFPETAVAVITAALAAVGFWPVWVWYLRRMTDGSDEPWGVLALVTAVFLVIRREEGAGCGEDGKQRGWQWAAAAGVLAIYVATFHSVPPLFRAAMAMSVFGILLAHLRGAFALWVLLLLSLPVVPTLQFFFGYPLRVLAAETTTVLLGLGGLEIVREGSALRWAGEIILVDAPCSGVRMIWASIFAVATLAARQRLGAFSSVRLLIAGLGIAIAANIARSTFLFFKEAHLLALPDWTHTATGLVAFALAIGGILKLAAILHPTPSR